MRRNFWKMPATVEVSLGNDRNDAVKKIALLAGIGAAVAGLFVYLKKNPKKRNKLIDALPIDKKAKKATKKSFTKVTGKNKKSAKTTKTSTKTIKKILKKKKLL